MNVELEQLFKEFTGGLILSSTKMPFVRGNKFFDHSIDQDNGIYSVTIRDTELTPILTDLFNIESLTGINIQGRISRKFRLERKLDNLIAVSISNTGLGNEIYNIVKNFSNLRLLDLSLNLINHIPNQLSNLNLLNTLVLSNNKISTVGDNLNLENLEVLDLSNNKLSEIPEFIFNSEKIHSLNISGNKFKLNFDVYNNRRQIVELLNLPL